MQTVPKEYYYSEIFHSIQGEGNYTGVPTAWLRFYLCNLQCNGFGQKDPTDPTTYDLPYEKINVADYSTMGELPVFERGCDSSYSWAKKFKSLQHKGTAAEICERIEQELKNEHNESGRFTFMRHGNIINQHMCFTGGEPLMKHAQECVVDMMEHWEKSNNIPRFITFETNGTRQLTPRFLEWAWEYEMVHGGELFMSVSPKLWTVSGEKRERAIKPDVVATYQKAASSGQLKFVVNGTQDAWNELEEVVDLFRFHNVGWPVWIMPAGATVEGQKLCDGEVAKEAFKRGYNVSARVHTYLWNNQIGV